MDEHNGLVLSEISPSQDNTALFHLYVVPKIVIEAKRKVTQAGGGGNGELFHWYNVSVMQDELILETCCTSQGFRSTTLYCPLKNLQRRSHAKCSYYTHKTSNK